MLSNPSHKQMISAYQNSLSDFVEHQLPRVTVYQNNQIAGRQQALHNHFPMVCKLLGEPIFAALAQAYASHYPSQSWDINLYGGNFSYFVKAQENGRRANEFSWPMLAWIADVEYALLCLYYADSKDEKDEMVIDLPSELASIEIENQLQNLAECHAWLSFECHRHAIDRHPIDCPLGRCECIATRHISANGFRFTINLSIWGTLTAIEAEKGGPIHEK